MAGPISFNLTAEIAVKSTTIFDDFLNLQDKIPKDAKVVVQVETGDRPWDGTSHRIRFSWTEVR